MRIGNHVPPQHMASCGARMSRVPALLFASLFALTLTHADTQPRIEARVSANQIALNETLTLSIEIAGARSVGAAPEISLPHFTVRKAGTFESVQIHGGQMSSVVKFDYQLRPTQEGSLLIPSLQFNLHGQLLATNPITVSVTPPRTASAPTGGEQAPAGVPAEGIKPLFMTANLNKTRAYVGEQLILTVQFLRQPGVQLASQARYSPPDMTGFLIEPLKQREYETTLNGTRYLATEVPYAIFPTADGDFAIGSATIEVAVRMAANPFDPDSFFESVFGRSRTARLNTRAIPVRVRALPENKPRHFTGAVGRFRMNTRIDQREAEVGKPVTLLATIEGAGNIKNLQEPHFPEMTGLRRYDSVSRFELNTDGNMLRGKKVFESPLIPHVSGSLTIPAGTFVFFDPDEHQYVTLSSEKMTLDVRPGTVTAGEMPDLPRTLSPAEGVKVVERDIRFIKTGKVHRARAPTAQRLEFFVLAGFPPLFALGAAAARWRSRARMSNADRHRSRRAQRQARRHLSAAKKALRNGDNRKVYTLINAAVTGFLADKFGVSAAGLLWEEMDPQLAHRGVPQNVRDTTRELLSLADMARFAPTTLEGAQDTHLQTAFAVLQELERYL